MSYQNNNGGGGYQRPYGGGGGGQGYQRPQGGFNNGGGGGFNAPRPNGGGQDTPREDRPLPAPVFYLPFGIISGRDTPAPIIERAKACVKKLAGHGYTVRTGALAGLEKEVISCAPPELVELQLPWKNFDNLESKTSFNSPEVLAIAKHFTVGWENLKFQVHGFLGKNVRIVLGEKARSCVLFLLVHSEDGAETAKEVTSRTGTAGHAIKVASHFNIPVFNLQKPDAEERLYRMFHLLATNDQPMIDDDQSDL